MKRSLLLTSIFCIYALIPQSGRAEDMQLIGFGIGHASRVEPNSKPKHDQDGTGIGHAYVLFESEQKGLRFEYPQHWRYIESNPGVIFGEVTPALELPLKAKVLQIENPNIQDGASLLEFTKAHGYPSAVATEIDFKAAVIDTNAIADNIFLLRQPGSIVHIQFRSQKKGEHIADFEHMLSTLQIETN